MSGPGAGAGTAVALAHPATAARLLNRAAPPDLTTLATQDAVQTSNLPLERPDPFADVPPGEGAIPPAMAEGAGAASAPLVGGRAPAPRRRSGFWSLLRPGADRPAADVPLIVPDEGDRPPRAMTPPVLDVTPETPWDATRHALRRFHHALHQGGSFQPLDTDGGWQRHQDERRATEAAMPPDLLASLPGRGTPARPLAEEMTLDWYDPWNVERYTTTVAPTGPTAADGATPVRVTTLARTGNEQVTYDARAFHDAAGVLQIDARGQRTAGPLAATWSPDSFAFRPDGSVRVLDDKFAGCSGSWCPPSTN